LQQNGEWLSTLAAFLLFFFFVFEALKAIEIAILFTCACRACFVPHYTKNNMEMVKIASLAEIESMPLTKWGIRQPDGESRA
jgi:hypothetical protein